jgi:signal transduction histidine kinase
MSSNIGLIRVLVSDLQAHVEGDLESVPGRLFDRYDGMASQECTGATRMTKTEDGNLLIPTLGGATILNPRDIEINDKIPKVYITDFRTDFQHRSLHYGNRIVVEPGIVRYEFAFTALSFIAPTKVLFKYMLKDIDQDWIEAGNEREVVYTNLPKGNYSFMVQASNNDGVWNEHGAVIRFKVEPYFYETTFFYIGVVFLIGLLIWGIIVWRVHSIERVNSKLRKLNEELDRFVYSASHDLRAPLSSVLGLVEIARLETTVEGKQQCLDMINTSVIKLDGFINDIIDYSRNQRLELQPELLLISEEIHDAFNDLKYLDKEHKIEKIVEADEQRKFVTDGRRLNVILKNIISNAIRYHNLRQNNPFIKVKVEYVYDKAVITIEDNGIGIDPDHLDHIFKMFYRADESSKGSGLGLYIVKETLDKIGGQVEVKSQLHAGSSFIITIPQLKLAID